MVGFSIAAFSLGERNRVKYAAGKTARATSNVNSTVVLGLRRTHLRACVKNPLRFAWIGSCFSQCSRSSAKRESGRVTALWVFLEALQANRGKIAIYFTI